MNEMAQWHSNNEVYLSAALEWLKLRLQQQAEAIAHSSETEGKGLFEKKISAKDSISPRDVQQAEKVMTTAANFHPPPALLLLKEVFGLSLFEQQVLLLCAAIELDTQVAPLCARAQDHPNRPYPTFALVLSLFEDPVWDVVSTSRPLRYWRLIEVSSTGTQTLTVSPLRADEHIVNFLKGLNVLDDRLRPFVMPMNRGNAKVNLPPSQQITAITVVNGIQRSSHRTLPIIQLAGSDPLSQELVAQHIATQLRLELYKLATNLLPSKLSELEILERLCERESRLLPILFYLDTHPLEEMTDGASKVSESISALNFFLNRSQGLFLVGTREIKQGMVRSSVIVDVEKPTTIEQRTIWNDLLDKIYKKNKQALFQDRSSQAALLASQFNLNTVTIYRIFESVWLDQNSDFSAVNAVKSELSDSASETSTVSSVGDRLWQACQRETRPHLNTLVQRLDPRATWNDIVLPDEETQLLHQIVAQVRQRNKVYEDWGFERRMNRGLGISTLFAGESGTGKTMAAEVLTNELKLDLYRIDLSAVVSKYIGETEKNLRRIFDAAEGGGAVLFFDEADALFGKRSEVKDSHDRYANIEINYLLQRIESYRGLAILATNVKNALDSAFMRRLRFIVNFPFPGIKERQAIWQKAFPPETPQEELNFKRLARFNLTGGNIHNIVLNAAFLAAQANTSVTMTQILDATRAEFRKLDRPINETDFQLST